MSARSLHLDAVRLQQLLEGNLPANEAAAAKSHLDACSLCALELEAYQGLFRVLGSLHRYAPAAGFADAVMARVVVRPQESAILGWLRRLVPGSRRGWALLGTLITAPAAPLLVFVGWMLTQPMLSPAMLWDWGLRGAQGAAQTTLAWLADRATGSGVWDLVGGIYEVFQRVPPEALGGALAFLAIAMPVSAWALIRLIRIPVGSVTHAN